MSHRNKKSNWPRFLCGIQTPSRSLLLQQSRYPLACFYQTAESPPYPCATKHSCGRSVQQRNHYPLASCIYQITWSTSLPTCNQTLVWKVGRPAPERSAPLAGASWGSCVHVLTLPCEASVQAEEQNTSVFLRVLKCSSPWASLEMFVALSCWVLSLERHGSAVGHTGRTMSPKLRVCVPRNSLINL